MLKQWLRKLKDDHTFSLVAVAVAAVALYVSGVDIAPGWVTYLAQLPALVILILTALARVNDIKSTQTEWVWQVRRIGLSFVGVAATGLVFAPFVGEAFPTWRSMLIPWGTALTWLSTPGMPPWSKYITGTAKVQA